MNYELIHGDALEAMQAIDAGSIDAIITDLPYGTTSNSWDEVIPFGPMWEQVKRVLRSSGVFVTTSSQPFTSALVMSNPSWFRHEWIWIKNRGGNFANTVREPMKEHESVLVFSPGKWTYNKQMQERTGAGLGRVQYELNWRSQSENYRDFDGRDSQKRPDERVPSSWQKFNVEVGLHPTQKPVALYEYLFRTYTNAGDTVLDFCVGCGSSGVAAIKTNRNFIGVDISKKYIDLARDRLGSVQPMLLDIA